jgi:hypothetical protein
MYHQIIKQPDSLYAVFSTYSDTWILVNATREDLIGWYGARAQKEARDSTARLIDQVDEDPRSAYCQFAMTFEEANAGSVEHGGEDLSAKLAPAAEQPMEEQHG